MARTSRNTPTPTATASIARATRTPAGARRSMVVAAVTTPIENIPSTVRLTTYHGGTTSAERSTAARQEIVDGVAAGRYRPSVERVFGFDEIVAAHRCMAENRGGDELVAAVDA